jgi:hypothetical protein
MKTKTTTLFILILTVLALSTTGFGCKEKEPEVNITEEPPITEQEPQEPSEEEQLVSLAESYTQIYGTFTEGNYSNLESLSDFMSTEYREETSAWLETKIGQSPSPTYGIMTEIVISKIINFELGYAEVLVVAERMKTNVRTLAEESYYQNCLIKFIKENNTWRVDKAIFLTNK